MIMYPITLTRTDPPMAFVPKLSGREIVFPWPSVMHFLENHNFVGTYEIISEQVYQFTVQFSDEDDALLFKLTCS